MADVDFSRVPAFTQAYIKLVTASTLSEAFKVHPTNLTAFLLTISEDKWMYRYAPEKWSVKEMVQHIIDAERIFAYRALCIARGDKTPLPGFEENAYAAASSADARAPESLLEELRTVQLSSAQLFNSFTPEALEREGTTNNSPNYVKGIGFTLIGHSLHHQHILKERYGL